MSAHVVLLITCMSQNAALTGGVHNPPINNPLLHTTLGFAVICLKDYRDTASRLTYHKLRYYTSSNRKYDAALSANHLSRPSYHGIRRPTSPRSPHPNNGTGLGGLFPEFLKTLSPSIAPTLNRTFYFSLQIT